MLELQVAVRNQEEARYYATADSNAGVAHKNKKNSRSNYDLLDLNSCWTRDGTQTELLTRLASVLTTAERMHEPISFNESSSQANIYI